MGRRQGLMRRGTGDTGTLGCGTGCTLGSAGAEEDSRGKGASLWEVGLVRWRSQAR